MPCDRLVPLVVGHEHSPEHVSLEGGGDALLRLPIVAWLAFAPAGPFLLETGMSPRLLSDPCSPVRDIYGDDLPELDDGDPLLAALATYGVAPRDLAGAAVSHLHVDHAGGLIHLAGGPPVAVQRRELRFARERAGAREAYWPSDYDDPAIRWTELDGDATITPGIDAISTPGHTPGHMSYRVELGGGTTWLLAIDAIDLQDGIDRDTPIGWSADPADAPRRRRSHDRLVAEARTTGARLVPGHCPRTYPALLAEAAPDHQRGQS